jgi:hypothetical protein
MLSEPPRVARVNQHELRELPADWSDSQRGEYLWSLLQLRGIDPNRFYHLSYHPLPRCWLLTQESAAGGAGAAAGEAGEHFFRRVMSQFRWAARAACAALAAHSPTFARCGGKYELPPVGEEVTPGDLANLLGGTSAPGPAATRFDGEGGWQARPSEN